MKVILLKDVAKVGRRMDVKNVTDGYALNFLIPNRLAEVATDETLKKHEAVRSRIDAEHKLHKELLEKALGDLGGTTITLHEKANEQGHLFSKVHRDEIATALKNTLGFEVAPDHIVLDDAIKTTGKHEVKVIVDEKEATVTLDVQPLEN